jgi:hypothetical protein
MQETMLTTIDNPFDPFTQFNDWYYWDVRSNYNTSAFLARIANVSDELSETDLNLALEQAIDEIVRENVSGVYKKVTRTVAD